MTYQPGDIGFCHSKGIISWSIRDLTHSDWNHAFLLDRPTADGTDWYIIQAEAHGVTNDKLLSSAAPGGRYAIVPLPASVDRAKVLEFARGEVGSHYGFLTIGSILITLWLPDAVNVMAPDTWICSALVGEALRAGGWVHRWPDVYQVKPGGLYDAVVRAPVAA